MDSEACFMSFDMPGSIDSIPEIDPIFFTCLSCSRKSARVKRPSRMAAAPLVVTSWSIVRSACSMRLSTSPMPRMRSAMRSGWNWSIVELLAGGREGDGPPDDLLDRQGRTAPGVAVELGEDHPVQGERGMEGLRGGHRVLTGHRIDDQEGVVRLDRPGDVPDLVHQVLVDRQTAGRVHDEHVTTESLGLLEACGGHRHRVGGLGEHRDAGLATEDAELFDGRRALQ